MLGAVQVHVVESAHWSWVVLAGVGSVLQVSIALELQ